MSRELDKAAEAAVRKRRRHLIITLLEVALGDLVALDGIPETKKALAKFQEQLELY